MYGKREYVNLVPLLDDCQPQRVQERWLISLVQVWNVQYDESLLGLKAPSTPRNSTVEYLPLHCSRSFTAFATSAAFLHAVTPPSNL